MSWFARDQHVLRGEPVVILEAMKMQDEIFSLLLAALSLKVSAKGQHKRNEGRSAG
ncbi:MAG: hypothetical protein MZV63_10920 [Marinilabiliales bacterium]|nr:hypothetical protein [Marinilabiliales bacterium]